MANEPDRFDIEPHELALAMEAPDRAFIILDVREPWELQLARLEDERLVTLPLGRLASQAQTKLPAPALGHDDIFVLCHHGLRSAAVVRWLRQHGWPNSYNVQGGIDAYQQLVDPAIGRY